MNYYNDNDASCVAWLKSLVACGLIPMGEVDSRSIADVTKDDLKGFTQCHFFAGIGGWSYALKLAGWPVTRKVWTGSCPCQPFSCAGKGKGTEDERHLWPEFFRLISECKPATVFGEQVASKDGRGWLARVRADLERVGYAVGAADLCAAGVGAPHIRQRLYWVADSKKVGCGSGRDGIQNGAEIKFSGSGDVCCGLDDAASARHDWEISGAERETRDETRMRLLGTRRADDAGCEARRDIVVGGRARPEQPAAAGAWSDAVLIPCRDHKRGTVYRRVPAEPAFQPLAHGVPGRVAKLRGLGNSIVPQVAATFIEAFMESME